MRRNLSILALVIVVAIGVWWWRRPSASGELPRAAPTTAPDVVQPRTAEPQLPTTITPGSNAGSGRTDDARPALPIDAPLVNPPEIQARMSDVHAHLQDFAKPCRGLGSKLASDAQYRFSFVLTIAAGEARVSKFEMVWSDVGSVPLETCLQDKLADAHWATSEPDWSTTAEDALISSELE